MEREKIFSELKSRIGETSLSDRTLKSYVEGIVPDEGMEPDDGWWGTQVSFLQSLQGQYNHDIAAYKRSLGNKPDDTGDGVDDNNGGAGVGMSDELRGVLEEIKQENAALRKRIDEADARHKSSEVMRDVRAAMVSNHCDREYILNNVLRNADIDVTKGVDAIVAELLPIYDREVTEAYGTGVLPRNGGTGGGNAKTAADSYFERKWKQQGQ